MGSPSVDALLQQAIAAAKGGQSGQAKTLLAQVLQQDARNAQAWLWLAGITHDPVEQETCLQRVLSIDPYNDVARQGLAKVSPRATQQLLKQGIAAVQSGDLMKGRALLEQVTDRDEKQASAWLWLSEVMDTQEEQITCLENVLALEPGNMEAQTRLLRLSSQSAAVPQDDGMDEEVFDAAAFDALLFGEPTPADAPEASFDAVSPDMPVDAPLTYGETPVYDSPFMAEEASATSGVSSMFGGYEMVDDAPASAEPVAWDKVWAKYKEPYSCPYCAAPAEESRKSCHACGRSLMTTIRSRKKRSWALWLFIVIELISALIGTYVMVGTLLRSDAELMAQLPAGTSAEIVSVVERSLWIRRFISVVICVASYLSLIALYMRWPPIWYLRLGLMIIAASIIGLGMLASLIMLILGFTIRILGLGTIIGPLLPYIAVGSLITAAFIALAFWLLFAMRDDFVSIRERILLGPDDGLSSGEDYLDQGMAYAHEGKWALAAVHFHRAINILGDDPEPYRVAAIAGAKLRDAVLARYAFDQFKRYAPDNPRLADLAKLVEAIK